MSGPNPIRANEVRAALNDTAANPSIQFNNATGHNSGTGIYGDVTQVKVAVNYSDVLVVQAASVSMPGATSLVMANDVVILQGSAAPTDGVTGAAVAGAGSLYLRAAGASSNAYINCNTKASPTWKLITRAA